MSLIRILWAIKTDVNYRSHFASAEAGLSQQMTVKYREHNRLSKLAVLSSPGTITAPFLLGKHEMKRGHSRHDKEEALTICWHGDAGNRHQPLLDPKFHRKARHAVLIEVMYNNQRSEIIMA